MQICLSLLRLYSQIFSLGGIAKAATIRVVHTSHPIHEIQKISDSAQENFIFLDDIQTNSKRCDLFTLEFPIFALSKKANLEPVLSERLIVSPNPMYGQPNMYDKETLIYVCSKLIQAQNNGVLLGNKVRFTGYDFLKFTGKKFNGNNYAKLKESLNRISSTHISFVKMEKSHVLKVTHCFGLI